jgi:hypothetical protein
VIQEKIMMKMEHLIDHHSVVVVRMTISGSKCMSITEKVGRHD